MPTSPHAKPSFRPRTTTTTPTNHTSTDTIFSTATYPDKHSTFT